MLNLINQKMNNELQFLTNDQISGLMDILGKDVQSIVNDKLKSIKETDNYKTLFETTKSTEKYQKKLKELEEDKNNLLNTIDLLNQLNSISGNFDIEYNGKQISIYYKNKITTDNINKEYEEELESINNCIEKDVFYTLKINSSYTICSKIEIELKARLQLLVADNFDTIINNMKQYINVEDNLYIKE
jgi:hypothetical protein